MRSLVPVARLLPLDFIDLVPSGISNETESYPFDGLPGLPLPDSYPDKILPRPRVAEEELFSQSITQSLGHLKYHTILQLKVLWSTGSCHPCYSVV